MWSMCDVRRQYSFLEVFNKIMLSELLLFSFYKYLSQLWLSSKSVILLNVGYFKMVNVTGSEWRLFREKLGETSGLSDHKSHLSPGPSGHSCATVSPKNAFLVSPIM